MGATMTMVMAPLPRGGRPLTDRCPMLASAAAVTTLAAHHRSPALEPAPASLEPIEVLRAIVVLQELADVREAELSDRAAEALGLLYHRYAGAVLRVARRITGNASDADDVLQEVFTMLPATVRKYHPGRFEAWLKRVTGRAALMQLRKRGRRREESFAALPDGATWSAIGPADFEALEDTAEVRRALGELREPFRQVVMLRVYAELSHHEIAKLLGITPNASEVRLCRAIKQLREILAWRRLGGTPSHATAPRPPRRAHRKAGDVRSILPGEPIVTTGEEPEATGRRARGAARQSVSESHARPTAAGRDARAGR